MLLQLRRTANQVVLRFRCRSAFTSVCKRVSMPSACLQPPRPIIPSAAVCSCTTTTRTSHLWRLNEPLHMLRRYDYIIFVVRVILLTSWTTVPGQTGGVKGDSGRGVKNVLHPTCLCAVSDGHQQ